MATRSQILHDPDLVKLERDLIPQSQCRYHYAMFALCGTQFMSPCCRGEYLFIYFFFFIKYLPLPALTTFVRWTVTCMATG